MITAEGKCYLDFFRFFTFIGFFIKNLVSSIANRKFNTPIGKNRVRTVELIASIGRVVSSFAIRTRDKVNALESAVAPETTFMHLTDDFWANYALVDEWVEPCSILCAYLPGLALFVKDVVEVVPVIAILS